MDDLINVEDMKKSYAIIDETIQSLDNKSVQMDSKKESKNNKKRKRDYTSAFLFG